MSIKKIKGVRKVNFENIPRTVENLDPELWRQFTAIARYNDKKVGHLLNDLIFVFVEKQKVIDNSPFK